jgi:hypothetical protein
MILKNITRIKDFNSINTAVDSFYTAFSFDGLNESITMAYNSAFDFNGATPFSVTTKIKYNSTSINYLAQKLSVAGGWMFDIRNATADIGFWLRNTNLSNEIKIYKPANLIIGNVYTIGVTYDGSKTAAGVTFYIDGVELTTTLVIVADNLTGSSAINLPLQVGTGFGNYSDMDLSYLRLWSIKLSAAQMLDDYNSNFPGGSVASSDLIINSRLDFGSYDGTNWTIPTNDPSLYFTSANMDLTNQIPQI